jgi:hypothetical protein
MSGLWSAPNVPHKGWTCVEVEDLQVAEGACDMCLRESIRYVHHMQHADYADAVAAGCMCAEKMEGDYSSESRPSAAKQREAILRNAASRRGRWLALRSWRTSKKGNPWIKKDGLIVTVFAAGARFKFSIKMNAGGKTYFSLRSYPSADLAKLASFDALTLLQSEHLQPNRRASE